MLVKFVAFALCHSQSKGNLSSCGCAALRQKWILLNILKRVLLINEKVILLIKTLYQFALLLRRIIQMFLVADNILVVRAFAMGAERTVRDNTVGSRERLMTIKNVEFLFLTLFYWYFQCLFLLLLSTKKKKSVLQKAVDTH